MGSSWISEDFWPTQQRGLKGVTQRPFDGGPFLSTDFERDFPVGIVWRKSDRKNRKGPEGTYGVAEVVVVVQDLGMTHVSMEVLLVFPETPSIPGWLSKNNRPFCTIIECSVIILRYELTKQVLKRETKFWHSSTNTFQRILSPILRSRSSV